jgi:hypothetical protein
LQLIEKERIMNVDLFTACIRNPYLLRQVSYQELKTLVYQFPYAAGLRQLLWEKSQIENHPETEKNLHLASLYSIDRPFLAEKRNPLHHTPGKVEQYDLISVDAEKTEQKKEALVPKANEYFHSWNESLGTPFTKRPLPQKGAETPPYRPVPIHHFINTKQDAAFLAERSIQENTMPVSETYAKLLVQQNQIDKAIEVYKRLILIFPEKSAFFAAEIEYLKNI